MPVKEFSTPYPVIDSDPHFSRVVRYMRPSDYAAWAAGTAAAPALLLGMGKVDFDSHRDETLDFFCIGLLIPTFHRKNGSRWSPSQHASSSSHRYCCWRFWWFLVCLPNQQS